MAVTTSGPPTSTRRNGSPPSRSRHSLTESLRNNIQSKIDYSKIPPIYKVPLWELDCRFGAVSKTHSHTIPLKDAVRTQRKRQKPADVVVMFAVRQVG
mmetsp:Transcript_77448/g.116413  ORF Transcript_77448/g.116413 Transcript_77448/m.116413 type:complete len:98 (-) Transcript_77448:634-927(-)